MTREEFVHRLTDLEWEDFEVKTAKGEVPKSSWETVSAFSNTSGGWLVFGIKQTGKEKIIVSLQNVYEDFILYLERNFGLTSEQLRNTFGITSENVRDDFGKHLDEKMSSHERMFLLLMLIVIEKTITAEKAAEILSVSGRTIETYFSTLKENGMIDRVGSRKEGYWKVKPKNSR